MAIRDVVSSFFVACRSFFFRQRKKNGAPVPHELDVPPEFDIE